MKDILLKWENITRITGLWFKWSFQECALNPVLKGGGTERDTRALVEGAPPFKLINNCIGPYCMQNRENVSDTVFYASESHIITSQKLNWNTGKKGNKRAFSMGWKIKYLRVPTLSLLLALTNPSFFSTCHGSKIKCSWTLDESGGKAFCNSRSPSLRQPGYDWALCIRGGIWREGAKGMGGGGRRRALWINETDTRLHLHRVRVFRNNIPPG